MLTQALADLQSMSLWELAAVVLAIAYLLLAVYERIECWYAAFFSTLIYIFLFWNVSLLMESLLNVYYLIMALYGWTQWRGKVDEFQDVRIQRWSLQKHVIAIAVILSLTLISGTLLGKNTSAALPYLDSFTTWAAVVTTYMVTQKVLENWIYWLIINPLSIFLYLDRGMVLTALLFVVYVVMSLVGLYTWSRRYRQQTKAWPPATSV